jgi:prepilin-type N-terminal cleavage/methylation domain-containing protein
MNNASFSSGSHHRRRGFTLVEIMIVVVIIGLLALLAYPAIKISKTNARSATFINDLRQARAIFEMFAMEAGHYPAEASPGVIPVGMVEAVKPLHWTEPTPIGGQWDWDAMKFGAVAGVSVFQPELTVEQMQKIDARVDDGDLDNGAFRQHAGSYMFTLE